MKAEEEKDKEYLGLFLTPLYECRNYKPKLGHKASEGYDLNQFLTLYNSDPFYKWIGLDSPFMFAAHKAAGGMTSIYRQIGIGCERLLRAILADSLEYESASDVQWSYETKTKAGKDKTLYLDGFIDLDKIKNEIRKEVVCRWIAGFSERNNLNRKNFRGIVFEVRQGYKSKDAKRQNADIDNATVAYASDLIPVFAIFSSQIDDDIIRRYRNNKCGILIGNLSNDPFSSIYAFCDRVLGYNLSAFFERNTELIRNEIQFILKSLLTA